MSKTKNKVDDDIQRSPSPVNRFAIEGVPELEGLELTPQELNFVLAYVSPRSGFDEYKAYRQILSNEEFKSMSNATFRRKAKAMLQEPDVRLSISRLLASQVSRRKEEIAPLLLNDLMMSASFDPATIIDEDGDWLGGDMLNVPPHLRRALVEGVVTKYFGKEADIRVREIKLVSKTRARSQLIELLSLMEKLDLRTEDLGERFTVNIIGAPVEGTASADDLFAMAAGNDNTANIVLDSQQNHSIQMGKIAGDPVQNKINTLGAQYATTKQKPEDN